LLGFNILRSGLANVLETGAEIDGKLRHIIYLNRSLVCLSLFQLAAVVARTYVRYVSDFEVDAGALCDCRPAVGLSIETSGTCAGLVAAWHRSVQRDEIQATMSCLFTGRASLEMRSTCVD